MSTIYGYVIAGMLVLSLIGTGYVKYQNMVDTIANQQVMIENRDVKIRVQNENLYEQAKKFEREMANGLANAKAEAKKEAFEEEVGYDKSNSRDITSTRIDLP